MKWLSLPMRTFFSGNNIEHIVADLRNGTDPRSISRRKITALSALGVLDFTLISLFQSGLIRRLPDLPGSIFDSHKVNSSRKAYALGLPDGTMGTVLYALTMVLVNFGGTAKETGRAAVWDKLTFVAASAGTIAGAQYFFDMVVKQKKICLYCVSGAVLSASMLAPALKLIRRPG